MVFYLSEKKKRKFGILEQYSSLNIFILNYIDWDTSSYNLY